MRQPLEIPTPAAEDLAALDALYRTTRDVRLRARAQIVLLAVEQRLAAPAIAAIVRSTPPRTRPSISLETMPLRALRSRMPRCLR